MSIVRIGFCVAVLMVISPTLATACPALEGFYPGPEAEWEPLQSRLKEIFDQCLESTEYFALLGAAELNVGNLLESLEALERSLLLDPDNGAALIDYAEALMLDGQLFAALEIHTILEDRDDVPEGLMSQLVQRRIEWQKLTKQTVWQAELGGGHDNNLNGAPSSNQIALTLSGEPIFLALSEEYRSASGAFFNAGLGAEHTRLTADLQHALSGRVRSRFSEDDSSDIVQLTGGYSQLRRARRFAYRTGLGVNHLSFSGDPLFSGVDLSQRLELARGSSACDRYLSGAAQNQIWHTQRRLDGLELKAGVGGYCTFGGLTNHAFSFELNIINNLGYRDARLGGDRAGWQALSQWRHAGSNGIFSAQLEMASILDEEGYSPLLANNERRRISRRSVSIQYVRPTSLLGGRADLVANLFYQSQESNIGLFQIEDSAASIGFRFDF